jgi:hypothetical protein
MFIKVHSRPWSLPFVVLAIIMSRLGLSSVSNALAMKTILVTGGNKGIGKAVSILFFFIFFFLEKQMRLSS